MDLNLTIKPKKSSSARHGWYIARWENTEYNRVLYIRDQNTVLVFSDDCDMVQLYDLRDAERLYKGWKKTTIKMEAN